MLIKGERAYRFENFLVAPLNEDEAIASAYLQLKREGLLQVFYSGIPPTLFQFAQYCLSKDSITLGCLSLDEDPPRLAGIGMISVPINMGSGVCKCEVSEVFFREFQKRRITTTFCKMMLTWIFVKCPALSVVYGTTPEHNRAALLFMTAMGFESRKELIPHYTVWQGKECGVVVSWLTRARWEGMHWFSSDLREHERP